MRTVLSLLLIAVLASLSMVSSTIIYTYTGAGCTGTMTMFQYLNYPSAFCVNQDGPSYTTGNQGLLTYLGGGNAYNSMYLGCGDGSDTLSLWQTNGATSSFAEMCMDSAEATKQSTTPNPVPDNSCFNVNFNTNTAVKSMIIQCNSAFSMMSASLGLIVMLIGFNFLAQKF